MLRINLIKLKKSSSILKFLKYSTNAVVQTEQVPVSYPPILDLSRDAKKERLNQSWHEAIQNVKSVEEKLIKINMPKYYGFNCILINHPTVLYNAMPLVEHYTRTHFIEQDNLHDFYKQNEAKADTYVDLIKKDIEDTISFCYKAIDDSHLKRDNVEPSEIENKTAEIVIDYINRVIINHLAKKEDHLFEADVDYKPRVEAYWVVGGIHPNESTRKSKMGINWLKDEAEKYIDRHVQYLATPAITIRSKNPLESVIPYESATKDMYAVPHFPYDSRVVGYTQEHRHATCIPGFWPGDKQEFGLLSYHIRGNTANRLKPLDETENQEYVHIQGMLHSYAWLLAQANYQGFNTYNEITYPLTAQTIVTNGQKFSFYTYQLNTTLIHSNNYRDNLKVNLCWGTKEMNLFDEIDDSGKVINLNEKVLKQLIQFYINQPTPRDIELKPYLDKDKPYIADIEEEEKRIWLENVFKNLVSNRPRHRLPYEIYHWEKIYKIDHKTRPMEARRRPFELGINPYNRRLDEHAPVYIPRCLRPELKKNKGRYAKTYYP